MVFKAMDSIAFETYLGKVFGYLWGAHTFSMAIKYRSLNIIEIQYEPEYVSRGISKPLRSYNMLKCLSR